MTALDPLLGKVYADGEELELGNGLNFKGSGVALARNPTTRAIDVTITGGGGSGIANIYAPVRVAADASITLSGTYTLQGVALSHGDLVLAAAQTLGSQSGVYAVNSGGAWSRDTGFDEDADLITGMGGPVLEGTYANGSWGLLTEGPFTLGTTVLDFKVEPFVDVTGVDGEVVRVDAGVASTGKVTDALIADDTIAVGKLASGGTGNNGKLVGVSAGVMALVAAPPGTITPLDEQGTALTDRASLQFSWMNAFDDGTRTQIRPQTRVPRSVVRAVSASNVTITSGTIPYTFSGLSGIEVLKFQDVIWLGAQTTGSENGFYRVWQVVGATASITRLSEMDAFLTNGLYVKVQQGTNAGQYWLALGNGALSASKQLPQPSVSALSWTEVPLDDYVLAGDNTTIDAGNWEPVARRALECLCHIGGWLLLDGTYRFTTKVTVWTRTGFRGTHATNRPDAVNTRLIFHGCAGFFAPIYSETWDSITYDAGVRPRLYLSDLLMSFESGTTDEHYGVLSHTYMYIKRCTLVNPYSHGFILDTSTSPVGAGGNGSSLIDCAVANSGLNAYHIQGADANNVSLHRCIAYSHGLRNMAAREYEPTTGHPSASSPALTLNARLLGYVGTTKQAPTAGNIVTLTGTLAFGAGACPLLRVEIDGVGAGTALGQATFRVSYDWDIGTGGAGATWAHSGVTTAATYALDGVAAGLTLNFPAGTYATDQAWTGGIFPGYDWGLYDDAFIGTSAVMCEFSSGSRGGIYAYNSGSTYEKIYQEGGTESDVKACLFIGGSPALRAGGYTTRLPWLFVNSSNAWQASGIAISDAGVPNAGNTSYGVNYIRSMAALSGDTTGYKLRIPTAATTIVEGWANNDAGVDRFYTLSTHALGTSCQGFARGVWLGNPSAAYRQSVIARASLPATGVPLTGGATSYIDGAWTVGSMAWNTTPGHAALMFRVRTNSGAASYNLAWSEVANPSCDMVALATGNQTRIITDGGHFVMAASTTAGASVITLGTTSALEGARMKFEIRVQSHDVTLSNGGAGGTVAMPDKVLTAGGSYVAEYKYDGTNWIGSAWVCI